MLMMRTETEKLERFQVRPQALHARQEEPNNDAKLWFGDVVPEAYLISARYPFDQAAVNLPAHGGDGSSGEQWPFFRNNRPSSM
jgi:hypothetical protein